MIKYFGKIFDDLQNALKPDWLNLDFFLEENKINSFFKSENRFAVLIGIDYLNDKKAKLEGCVLDAYNLRDLLIEKFGFKQENIIMIVDDEKSKIKPTKANILNQLKQLVNKTQKNKDSSIFISYSGQGTKIDDKKNKDEVWIPLDYKKGIITDEQFRNIFLNKLSGDTNCIILSDTCHSGTFCDCSFYFNNENYLKIKKNLPNKNANVIIISGCRNKQTLNEVNDGLIQGTMTYSFINSCSSNKDFETLVKDMNNICRNLKLQQIPSLTCSNKTCAKLNIF